MSALEDSLRAVYKLPQVGTGAVGGLRRETGALVTDREIGEYMRPMTGAQMTADELRAAMQLPRTETGALIRDDEMQLMGRLQENPALRDLRRETGALINEEELTAEEQETLENLLQQTQQRSQAPLVELTDTLQAAGTGEDTILAHLTPGEVILAPQFFEDPEFEKTIENKFKESGLDPAAYTAGSGIANLNVETGAPEYGFFKKIGKGLKKVVKKVAPIAAFIPGVGTALGGVLGGIGGLAGSALTKVGLGGVASTLGGLGSTVAGGIANLGIPGISSIAGGTTGGFANIGKGLGSLKGLLGDGPLSGFLGGQQQTVDEIAGSVPGAKTRVERLRAEGLSDAEIMKDLQFSGYAPQTQGNFNLGRAILGGEGRTPQAIKSIEDLLKGQYTPGGAGGAGGSGGGIFPGGGGGGFGNFAKMAGIGALSAGLGKLAYEDAKKQKGVGLTPLTTMSPTGRYNIEAEIARRMGQQRPNPVEFGLLPEGTLPQLSGGQPRQAALGGAIEELQGGMARGMQEGGTVDFGSSPRNVARDFLMRAEENTRLKQTPEYELASRSAAKGAPPELLPKIAENVIKNLGERDVAAFTDEEVTVEIMRQLRPYTGNTMSRSEVDAVRSMMNKMYAPKSQGIGSIMSMMGRTPIMAFAQGGAVAMQEGGEMDPKSFPRMDGDINGPGTEQSDDIPAMLSDGEFVMTARAVRGAGSYEMQTEPGGIINLVPSLKEDRERGMDVMYKVMDTFSGQANPS